MSQLGNSIPSFDGSCWGKTHGLRSPPSPPVAVLVGYGEICKISKISGGNFQT